MDGKGSDLPGVVLEIVSERNFMADTINFKKVIRELLQRKDVTSRDVMKAGFGEWPPKGLDIVDFIEEPVAFKSFFDDGKQSFWKNLWSIFSNDGYVYGGWDDIYLNPKPLFLSRFWNRSARHMNLVIGHEQIHLMQKWCLADEEVCNTTHKILGQVAIPKFLRDSLDALLSGKEIQARLHEAMIEGYPRWGRLPLTKLELWAALGNAGYKIPSSIDAQLENTEEGKQARLQFGKRRRKLERYYGGLHLLHMWLRREEQKEKIGTEFVPQLYGGLLELYGDRLGRERMGGGINIRLGVVMFYKMLAGREEINRANAERYLNELNDTQIASLFTGLMCDYIGDKEKAQRAKDICQVLGEMPRVSQSFASLSDEAFGEIVWKLYRKKELDILSDFLKERPNPPVIATEFYGKERRGNFLSLVLEDLSVPDEDSGEKVSARESSEAMWGEVYKLAAKISLFVPYKDVQAIDVPFWEQDPETGELNFTTMREKLSEAGAIMFFTKESNIFSNMKKAIFAIQDGDDSEDEIYEALGEMWALAEEGSQAFTKEVILGCLSSVPQLIGISAVEAGQRVAGRLLAEYIMAITEDSARLDELAGVGISFGDRPIPDTMKEAYRETVASWRNATRPAPWRCSVSPAKPMNGPKPQNG